MINHDPYLYRDAHVKQWRRDRRERIATAALQGILANEEIIGGPTDFAKWSVRYADALIAALDKEPQP